MFLRSECSAKFDHAWSDGLSHEPVFGSLTQNVLELLGIVGSEKNVQLAQSRANPRVEEIGELEVVRDANNAGPGRFQGRVHVGQVVEQIVAGFADQMVDFVKHNNEHATALVHSTHQLVEDSVGRPTGEGDFVLFKLFEERIADVTEHPILGVNLPTVDDNRLDLSVHRIAFGSEMVAHVVGDGGFAGPGDTVEGHVAGDVAGERFPEVVRDFFDFFLPMR